MLSRLTFGSKSVMEGVKNLIISTRVCITTKARCCTNFHKCLIRKNDTFISCIATMQNLPVTRIVDQLMELKNSKVLFDKFYKCMRVLYHYL